MKYLPLGARATSPKAPLSVVLVIFFALIAALPAVAPAQEVQATMNLIPQPRSMEQREGRFRVVDEMRLFLPSEAERPEWLAAQELVWTFEDVAGVRPRIDRLGMKESPAETTGAIVVTVRTPALTEPGPRDGYTLSIAPDAVRLEGNSLFGVFYGLQTLRQLAEQHGADLPALMILDEPDFAWRGFYHDVTRGKVPTVQTLRELVDFLAERKINMLQLYVEHTFQFRFDPEIAHNEDGLTSEEILEIQEYCKDKRIEFTPSLQSFGHMAGVFSLDRYRHLADVEMQGQWDDLPWHPRMRGATIDVSNPEAIALLEQMYDHFLPLFDSQFFNACADETYDLGEGKTKELAAERGKGRLYLDHIERLNEMTKGYGKRLMFWGDIVKQHAALVPEIPKDTILLNWGYSANTDFESSKLFADAGLDFFVCPGTSGWNCIVNRIENADLNIRRYAATGKKYGAMGLLNTDWGDHGHYNPLGGSMHGIALGAAMAWNTEGPDQETFDRIWSIQMFGDPEARGINALRKMTNEANFYTWTSFYPPIQGEPVRHRHNVTEEQAHGLIRNGHDAVEVFQEYHRRHMGDPLLVAELLHTSRMMILLGEKALIQLALQSDDRDNAQLASNLRRFADQVEASADEYEKIWLARNKPSELHEITSKLKALEAEARELADSLQQ